jgi:antitoxin (DNA-binding transcriptional repressor) of toxin-antitoxin stability system
MPTVNIRQLRQTRQLKAWLRAGKKVTLKDRDTVIAEIVPAKAPSKPRPPLPDFAAIRKRILGDRVLPGADLLIEERGRY